MQSLESRLKQKAHELGFELVGIASAGPTDGFERLREWLDRGYAGEMDYMGRHAEARRHPAGVLPDVRSVVMAGMNYNGVASGEWRVASESDSLATRHSPPSTRVARYAQGADYHQVLRNRLKLLLAWLQRERPECRGRAVVDTAPLLERDIGRRAGLGWFGKNTLLINKRLGSYFFLGGLLVDVELAPDAPHEASHCGSCTACLDACPTNAFAGPGWLDSRRCISYLTIELRDPVPDDLRSGVGNWLFGCDICQEVCPWNRKAPLGLEPLLQPRTELEALDPIELLGLDEEAFRGRFRGTALTRTKRAGLLRNAALVLGNTGDASALPALEKALGDLDSLVRDAAAWAMEQIKGRLGKRPAQSASEG